MNRLLRSLVLIPLLIAFGACQAEAYIHATPTGVEAYFKGKVGHNGQEGTPPGKSMGTGKVVLEDGSEFTGEFFDSNDDGKPDNFKPDAGQSGSGGGVSGTTTGNEYYPYTPE